jgi:hypothetical protein
MCIDPSARNQDACRRVWDAWRAGDAATPAAAVVADRKTVPGKSCLSCRRSSAIVADRRCSSGNNPPTRKPRLEPKTAELQCKRPPAFHAMPGMLCRPSGNVGNAGEDRRRPLRRVQLLTKKTHPVSLALFMLDKTPSSRWRFA